MKRSPDDLIRNLSSDKLPIFNYSQTVITTKEKSTTKIKTEGALNALASSPGQEFCVVAGRDVLKIFSTGSDTQEVMNLRSGIKSSIILSSNDVKWGEPMAKNLIVTASSTVLEINHRAQYWFSI